MDTPEIKQFLIVAGHCGAGKSTFIRALKKGRLPEDVLNGIPKTAGGWPKTTCKFLLKHGIGEVSDGDETPSGLVLEYPMTRPYRLGLPDYRVDKVLGILAGLDAAISVVTILTEPETLIEHIRRRRADAKWIAEEAADGAMLRNLRRQVRAAVCKLVGMPDLTLNKHDLEHIRLFESPGFIELWLEHWKAFLEHLRQTETNTRFVYVSPDPASNGGLNFRLVETR